MISIKELTVDYKGLKALDSISLELNKGDRLALLGQNGAGKSSLLKSLIGEIHPSKGDIFIDGSIGILPEGATPYTGLRVREYLEFIACLKEIPNPGSEVKRVISLCKLDNKSLELTTSLSKGLKQRVMLASALLGDPDIIVLDEPSSGLDPLFQREILTIIEESSKGKSVIFSTHNISDAYTIANRVVVLKEGKISFDKKIENASSVIVRFRGEINNYPKKSAIISKDTISINGGSYGESVKAALKWVQDSKVELLEIRDSREWSYLYEFF